MTVWKAAFCIFFFYAMMTEARSDLRPTRSVVDYLKIRQQDSSFQSRESIFRDLFPGQKYTGSATQNSLMLQALLKQEASTAPRLVHSLTESRRNLVLGLIGGFGWGSRDSEDTPGIWEFRPNSCRVEPGIVADIRKVDAANCVVIPAEWDGGLAVASGIASERRANPGSEIVLVGHSFGGSSVVDVAALLEAKGIRVSLAVLIDPVNNNASSGTFGSGQFRKLPSNVGRWVVITAAGDFPLKIARPNTSYLEFVMANTDHERITDDKRTHEIISVLIDHENSSFGDSEFNQAKKQFRWADTVEFRIR